MQLFRNILQKSFIKKIQSEGGKIYFVGGCVRDYFLNKDPKDIDIVVQRLTFEELTRCLSVFGKVDVVGESFGVIKFKEFKTNFEIEIALPRTDSKDQSAKGHTSIIAQSDPFLSIEKDLKRRDFTINSIAIDEELRIIDPFDGIKDLVNKIIKTTDIDSFIDDPLRMLRAVQFAARFNFIFEVETHLKIRDNSELLKEISKERILMEFQKVFDKDSSVKIFLQSLISSKLFETIFELSDEFIDHYNVSLVGSLAEFLFYCCQRHKQMNPKFQIAEHLKNKLKIDNLTYKQVKALEYYFYSSETISENLLLFNTLQIYSEAYTLSILEMDFNDFLYQKYPKSYKELRVSGDDIMNYFNLKPGPEIGIKQRQVLEAVLEDKVQNNQESCLRYLESLQQQMQ